MSAWQAWWDGLDDGQREQIRQLRRRGAVHVESRPVYDQHGQWIGVQRVETPLFVPCLDDADNPEGDQ